MTGTVITDSKKMKGLIKNITVIVVLCFFILVLAAYFKEKRTTDNLYYRQQFDSLKTEIFRIKAELDEVKANTDTLKVGQRIIYDEVKKNAEKSFWDFFK